MTDVQQISDIKHVKIQLRNDIIWICSTPGRKAGKLADIHIYIENPGRPDCITSLEEKAKAGAVNASLVSIGDTKLPRETIESAEKRINNEVEQIKKTIPETDGKAKNDAGRARERKEALEALALGKATVLELKLLEGIITKDGQAKEIKHIIERCFQARIPILDKAIERLFAEVYPIKKPDSQVVSGGATPQNNPGIVPGRNGV